MHFHPDRPVAGVSLLQVMAAGERYRSQFETGTSNGGLTAHPGGDRWRWESRLFARAYDDARPATRPIYGSLNHRQRQTGGSPRFGSAHLRLTAAALARSTFCYPDSVFEPVNLAVAEHVRGLTELADAAVRDDESDPLDDYVEAHVHGGLRLAVDVEALVLDPSYRDTEVEADALLLSRRHGIPLEWHPGFSTTAHAIAQHPDYRGPHIVAAAERIAGDRALTPRVIGLAARTGAEEEQVLKLIWHYVARFGSSR